jgi:hypothetical protein
VVKDHKKRTIKGEAAKEELWKFLSHYAEHSLMGCSAIG